MRQKTAIQLARVLRVLVLITLVCNLLALLLVPAMVASSPHRTVEDLLEGAGYLLGLEQMPEDYIPFLLVLIFSWLAVWTDAYAGVLTAFLLACGVCTAVILWQGKRVLDTILKEKPFCGENAGNLKRAAVCCFLISAFALVRVVWGMIYYQAVRPLLTYCGLFVPVFLMAGLLCLVMSALFRQAAEMKAENDLTI